jgi:hypothetical protein
VVGVVVLVLLLISSTWVHTAPLPLIVSSALRTASPGVGVQV